VSLEWYRDDLDEAQSRNPYPVLIAQMIETGISQAESEAKYGVKADFGQATSILFFSNSN
jgi:2-oxoisovalerate dehydrogenase E1 component